MNKKYIANKLKNEYKTLWELSHRQKIDSNLTRLVSAEIRQVRRELNSFQKDILVEKQRYWGNEGSWGKNKMCELARVIWDNNTVDGSSATYGQYLSVEIECIFIDTASLDNFVSFVRKNKLSKFVCVKDDGSLRTSCGSNCDYDCDCRERVAKEIVVTFQDSQRDILQKVCAELQRLNCLVNRSCGLHVHFDVRHLTARQVTTLGKRIANAVPALKMMLPVSRRNNQYCSESINTHRASTYSGRYAFVNLSSYGKHKTLEIRGHSGTICDTKILNWIDILQVIMKKRNTKSINNIDELVGSFDFDEKIKNYILARADKFSDSSQDDSQNSQNSQDDSQDDSQNSQDDSQDDSQNSQDDFFNGYSVRYVGEQDNQAA